MDVISGGLNDAEIVGVIFGVLIALVLIALAVFFGMKYQKKQKEKKQDP